MGDESIAALRNKKATDNATASPAVQYQTFLPWLGATGGTLPNTIESPFAGNNKNAGRDDGETLGKIRMNAGVIYPSGYGYERRATLRGLLDEQTGTANTGGTTTTGGATGGTPYDPGPMQGLLAQQLAAGFGGDPATYNAQLTGLYQPMTIPRIINGQDMAALKASLPKDKKAGRTSMFGYGG